MHTLFAHDVSHFPLSARVLFFMMRSAGFTEELRLFSFGVFPNVYFLPRTQRIGSDIGLYLCRVSWRYGSGTRATRLAIGTGSKKTFTYVRRPVYDCKDYIFHSILGKMLVTRQCFPPKRTPPVQGTHHASRITYADRISPQRRGPMGDTMGKIYRHSSTG